MAEPMIYPVGHRFTDSDGNERVKTPFGFNAYVTEEGARSHALALGRNGQYWYVWRLADGSYDCTAVPDPTTPGHPAELAETVRVSGYGKRKKVVTRG